MYIYIYICTWNIPIVEASAFYSDLGQLSRVHGIVTKQVPKRSTEVPDIFPA